MNVKPMLNIIANENKTLVETVGRYYLHHRTFDRPYPALDFFDYAPKKTRLLDSEKPLGPDAAPYKYSFARPVPPRPVLGDFHDNEFPVISDRIKDAISPLILQCAEFVPAELIVKEKVYPYWILHHLLHIDALDKENSDFGLSPLGTISYIDKFYLDYAALSNIPLHQRMVFKLKDTANQYLWHEDVVRAIEAINPTGIGFGYSQGYEKDLIYFPPSAQQL